MSQAIAREFSVHGGSEAVKFSQGGLARLPKAREVSDRKARLGELLFSDPRLSKTSQVSCRSCHDLDFYGADAKTFSIGISGHVGTANAPTVFNAVFNFKQFWDGRASSLADQVQGPIHNPIEMGISWPEILTRLKTDDRVSREFNSVYGHEADEASAIDAIVAFESKLTTPNAPFDRFLAGDLNAMNEMQVRGFEKFQNYGCVACHQGANVGGNMFQTLGIMGDYFKDRGGSFASDAGRFAVTGDPVDLHVFRVPSLRNVAMTPPYFHDGQAKSLDQAVKAMAKYQLGRELSERDVKELVSFLNALTGDRPTFLKDKKGAAVEKTH